MAFDLSSATPVKAAASGGFDLQSAKPITQSDDYEPLYQKYVSDYNDTKNQVQIPGTPPVDQVPLLSKEQWKSKNDKRFRNNLMSIPLALGEQALNMAGGVAGTLAAPVVAGGKFINDVSQGNPTSFEKDYSQLFNEASSIGTKVADMTGINTGARESIQQGVGNFMNRVGIPMAGLNLPHINKNAELRRAMPEAFVQPEIPKAAGNPVLDKLSAFDLNSAKPVMEETSKSPTSTAMSPSQLKEWADIQERYAQYRRGELPEQKAAAAQAAIDARQKALEQDVARQGGLDFNAAERARQEAAPTGYADWVEQQRQGANERLPGNNEPMDLGPSHLTKASQYPDVNDYPNLLQDAPYQYEGGIDYTAPRDRSALPVEVADILQTGVKNPDPFNRVSYNQNAKRMAAPLEEHIANLNRSEGQPNALSRFEGEGNRPVSPETAVTPPDSTIPRWEGEGGKFGQRGAIDMSIFNKDYVKDKDLENGIKLRFVGGQEPTVYALKDGEIIGHTAFMRDKFYQDPKPTDTLEARWTHTVPEHQQQGIAKEMYKFTKELGNDIQASSVQTGFGKKMWESFDRQGMVDHSTTEIGNPKRTFKNSQAGKIDLQSIKDEAEKVGKWFSSVGAKAMDNLTPKERVVLNAIGDDSYLPKGDSPANIIAAAKAQPDGPALFTQMQSGLGGAALKSDSAMMFGVNRHLQWAHKMAAKAVREHVKPLEQLLSGLNNKELETANGIFRKELFDRKQFTEQQLIDAGASRKTIDAYNFLRDKFEDVYQKTNESRAKLGLDPITKQGAYYSSQWNGNWHMPVYDKSNSLIGYVKTETRAEANKAMAWIKDNMPEADASRLKVEYKSQNIGHGLPRDVTSTFETMMKIFEDTPMAQQMKEMMDQYRTEQAFNERGHSKHFEEKANARFFLGDRPWLSEKENAHAGLKAQVNYLKEAYRWAPLQESMANIKEVLSDPDLIKNQPNNMAVTKAYVANAMGISQSVFRGLESDVAQITGRSPSNLGKYISTLKSLTYLQQLGMSAGYAIATPVQAFILGPSRHLLLSKEGYKYNPLTTMVKSMKDMAAVLSTHEAYNITGKDYRGALSPLGREALRYMEDNGIINMNLFDEYANLGENRPMNLLKNTVGATISFPEKMARSMTFMSFVHHLNDGGMKPGLEMFQRAEELTNATLTEFHKNARPLLVDRMGMTGELLYTYKSPLFNFYNSLFEFANHASKTGDYKPLAAALFMTGSLGGVMNLPGVQEMDGAWSLFKSFIAKYKPAMYQYIRDTGIKETALKHLPDWATYGAMSTVTGAQMESRFSNQIVDPNNPLANVAPVAQEIKEQAAIGKFALNPNWTTAHEGAYQNLPPALKGIQETTADSFKAEKRGDGTQTYYNPNQLENRQAYVNRTPGDERYRRFGLTSLSEARQRDVRFNSNEESKRLETARDSSMTKMFDAVIGNRPEDIQKYAVSYFMNDGNGDEFQKELASKIMASALTPEERQVVYTKTISDVQNLLRQLQMNRKVQ